MKVEQIVNSIHKKRSIEESIEKISNIVDSRIIENSKDNHNKIKGNRDDNIYIYHSTLRCILDKKCIPCLYKLFPEGINDRHLQYIIQHNEYSNPVDYSYPCINSYPKNQRPENCIRSKTKLGSSNTCTDNIYSISNYNILTLGDGDFSFSLSLAANKHKDSYISATSHETKHSLLNTYPQIDTTLNQLNTLHVATIHGVDATSLQDTLKLPSYNNDCSNNSSSITTTFDYIIWNFPCISLPAGADGQSKELQANKELLTKFFLNIYPYLTTSSGEIHITHKTIEPFSWWDIKQIAIDCGYEYIYGIVFDRCNYPGYMNRKALDSKSFPCHDAQTYVFIPTEAAILLSNNRKISNNIHGNNVNTTITTTTINHSNNLNNNNDINSSNINSKDNILNHDEYHQLKKKKEYKKTQLIITKWKENTQNKLYSYLNNNNNNNNNNSNNNDDNNNSHDHNKTNHNNQQSINMLSNLFDNEIIKVLNNYLYLNYQK